MATSFLGASARYFLEVARTGSIAVAAEELHVASSAISRQISKLEESVGCQLFERRARGMVLSEAGERLALYMRNTSLQGERVLEEIKAPAKRAEKLIRIACTEGFACGFLAEVMSKFRRDHQDCFLTLTATSPQGVSGLVARGEADVGLKFSVAPERGLRVEHTQPAPIVLVTSVDHPIAGKRRIALKDVRDLPLGLPVAGTTLRQILDLVFQTEDMRSNAAFAGNLPTLLDLTVRGDAVVFSSVISVSHLLSAGKVVALAVPELAFHQRSLLVLTHDEDAPSGLRRQFVDSLIKATIDHG